MGIEFGKNARKQVLRGDMVASFEYVNGEEALCLWRAHTMNSPLRLKNSGAAVICLSAAHQYTDDDYLVAQAAKMAVVMGFRGSRGEVHALASFIQDMLIELCTMLPAPIEAPVDRPTVHVIDGSHVSMELH